MWEPQLALSAHGWRVIAPHLRGFDAGSGDPPASSVDDYAGDVVDLLDTLRIDQAVVGGLSMGGYVAFALLRQAPSYVQALILSNTRAPADTPDAIEGRKRMLQLVADRGVAAVVDEMIPKLVGATARATAPDVAARVRALAESNSPEAVAGAIRALMTRPDSTPLLGSIHCPTLVVAGDEDVITPPAFAEELNRGIAGSRLVTIAQAGHLSSLEQPAIFNAEVAAFLTGRV
jgi:pimeloyl-ACP methyl ester carboxylesterase